MTEEQVEDPIVVELNEEIITLKKKIQLSEGQRKAQYEEYDSEKKKNIEEIKKLKKYLKQLTTAKPVELEDTFSAKFHDSSLKFFEIQNKRVEDVQEYLDLKTIDLQKKLDLLKYEIFQKRDRMLEITKTMEEILMETDKDNVKQFAAPIQKDVSRLENKIHMVNMNVLEMKHMQKKYSKIKESLQEDSVHFESTLNKTAQDLQKQEMEISKLQIVKDEAIRLRDKTRNDLAKLEAEVIAEGMEREAELQGLQRKVEAGKSYLERVERSLVPSVKPLAHQESGEDLGAETEDAAAKEAIEFSLAKLKHITGAKDEKEILVKFHVQKNTRERLVKLKETVEKEKKELERKKEKLEAELETHKFAQVKEKEQNEEELEELKNRIEVALKEKKQVVEEYERDQKQLDTVKNFLMKLCYTLQDYEPREIPLKTGDNAEITGLIDVIKNKVTTVMDQVDRSEVMDELIKDDLMNEDALGIEEDVQKEKREEKEDGGQTVPQQDVPSRSFLKRQSQLIVEAKTRRKGFGRDPLPSNFK